MILHNPKILKLALVSFPLDLHPFDVGGGRALVVPQLPTLLRITVLCHYRCLLSGIHFFFDFANRSAIFAQSSGVISVKGFISPAPLIHSPPSIVTTSPLM